ncbi:uncharacterized protein LOC108324522 [Vigna angularis]|uniref:uncharacterized protein LOC108324522 n=1 Tax=Phaseolus angularis TaxID=3914 RepID=UPI000809EFD3|nr:uncharacterized protein LOC108324522 [Vigna angularis]
MEKYVRENPNMKVMDIRDKVSRKWNVGISRNMDFRARAMTKDNIEGSFKEQYRRIYDYGHELLRANTGKYGGELLTAVGRDGNEQILPIAYVVVEVENKDSWNWFLELIIADLGGEAGLLPAIQDLLPKVEQRFCVRHLYSNFKKKYPGKDLKCLMWRAATATYPQLWEVEMRKIKEINVEAFKYLIAIPPTKSTYEETYNTIIYPINGQLVWDITSYPDVLPLKKRTGPGRPKKKRRLEAWELKKNDTELRKDVTRKTCALCKELGHNKRACPQRPTTPDVPPD